MIMYLVIPFMDQKTGMLPQLRALLVILLAPDQTNTDSLQRSFSKHYHQIKLIKLSEFKIDVSASDYRNSLYFSLCRLVSSV
jgi:hypothetical protein